MIERLLSIMNRIPADKLSHIFWSLVGFTVLHFLMSALLAVVVVSVVGVLKDYAYDRMHQDIHTVDLWDVTAGFTGVLLGYLCTLNRFV